MAWREFDLWRPFLRRFVHGERCWPTWTFWPGTVFTREAAADLVELANDPQLVALLARTRLWATEELVVPTLVALRGHRVVPTPLRDDLVRFRVHWSQEQVASASRQPELFWVHPVLRRLDDPLRSWLRSGNDGYPVAPASEDQPERGGAVRRPGRVVPRPLLEPTRVLRSMDALEGSLTHSEGDLLLSATLNALTATRGPHAITHVGPLSARERHVIGAVSGAVDPSARLVRAGDERNGEQPALVLLGGASDFAAAATAWSTVETDLQPGALVAFRDYTPTNPGVVRLLDHLVTDGVVEWVGWVGSLAVARFVLPTGVTALAAVLDEMDAVDGWLSRDEAAYLGLLTAGAVRLAPRASVVEVGSYCGRGTVVLARASTNPLRGRVHAVDTFDGVVGSSSTGLHRGEPTWDRFRALIEESGLTDRVVAHRGRSQDVDWDQPVSMLVVDGWHDYDSVRADVDRFASNVVVGGTVAFHDHAAYAPDVARVLSELVGTGEWERVGQVGTLAGVRRTRPPAPVAVVAAADRAAVLTATTSGAAPVLVSCLMPTADRPDLVRFALATFARQDVPGRELVVVDDGDEPVRGSWTATRTWSTCGRRGGSPSAPSATSRRRRHAAATWRTGTTTTGTRRRG